MKYLTLLTFFTIAVVTDFREMKISNRLIASGFIWGLAFRIRLEGLSGIVHFLVGISIPVILLFLFFQMHALGAGDIKLFSVAGGFLTWKQMSYLIPVAFCTASAAGAVKLLYEMKKSGHLRNKRTLIHFSIYILISFFVVVWGWAIE